MLQLNIVPPLLKIYKVLSVLSSGSWWGAGALLAVPGFAWRHSHLDLGDGLCWGPCMDLGWARTMSKPCPAIAAHSDPLSTREVGGWAQANLQALPQEGEQFLPQCHWLEVAEGLKSLLTTSMSRASCEPAGTAVVQGSSVAFHFLGVLFFPFTQIIFIFYITGISRNWCVDPCLFISFMHIKLLIKYTKWIMKYLCGGCWIGSLELNRENGSSSNSEAGHTKEGLLFNIKLLLILLQLSLKQELPWKNKKNRKNGQKMLTSGTPGAVVVWEWKWEKFQEDTVSSVTLIELEELTHFCTYNPHFRPEIAATDFKYQWRRSALELTDDVGQLNCLEKKKG